MAYRPGVSDESILDLALVGSRARGFNHDAASKLQRLMMATSEAEELAGPNPSADHRATIDSLHSALAELEALFAEFRLLTKGREPATTRIAGVLQRAARRANLVLALDLDPTLTSVVSEPELVQALAVLLDAADRGGPLAVHGRAGADGIELELVAVNPELDTAIALVTHVLHRTGGSIVRDGQKIRIVL